MLYKTTLPPRQDIPKKEIPELNTKVRLFFCTLPLISKVIMKVFSYSQNTLAYKQSFKKWKWFSCLIFNVMMSKLKMFPK